MTHVVVDPVTRIEGHLRIEAEVDGGGVEHDPVPHRDGPDQLRQRVGPSEVGADALETGPLLEDLRHHRRPEGGHYNDAMSFSTRSSRDRNGSLQRTVR